MSRKKNKIKYNKRHNHYLQLVKPGELSQPQISTFTNDLIILFSTYTLKMKVDIII